MTEDDRMTNELKQRFAALRDADRRAVPSLDGVLAGRAHSTGGASRKRMIWTATLGVAAAASVAFAISRGRERPTPVPIEVITAWQAPTDALLPAELPPVFSAMPPLNASVIDAFLP